MATCPRCGTYAPEEERFCRTCGGYLTTATPSFDEVEHDRGGDGPHSSPPPGIPAIDDDAPDGPPRPGHGGHTFDDARLPMNAYPVERPAPDDWTEAPTQHWHVQDQGGQPGPPPQQGPPPYEQGPPPYEQGPPPYEQGPPPYEQGPPFGQRQQYEQPTQFDRGPQYGQTPQYGQAPSYEQAPPYEPYGDGYGGGGYEAAGYYPYDESQPGQGHGGRTAIIAIVAVIAVVALIFGGVLFVGSRRHGTVDASSTKSASGPASQSGSASSSSSPPSSSSAAGPQQQADAVNGLLNRAVDGKTMLTSAYDKALACKISPADAATQFEQAAKNRRDIVRSARRLDTSKLRDGARIRQLLISMYSTSAKADDAFADWAHTGDVSGADCLSADSKRAKGNRLSIKAGKQKKSFTKVWNPVARSYGEPQRTKSSL